MRIGADDKLAGSYVTPFDHDIMADAALVTFINGRAMFLGKLPDPFLTLRASVAARWFLVEVDNDLFRIPSFGDAHVLENFFEYPVQTFRVFRFRKPQILDVELVYRRIDHVSCADPILCRGSRADFFSDGHSHSLP